MNEPTQQGPVGTPTRSCRVLLVAPSLRYIGGQAIQAQRLADYLNRESWVTVRLFPVDPVLTGPLSYLQQIKYVRTIVTTFAYVAMLLRTVPQYDVVHAFSASYWSFLLAPTPAILIGRLFRKRVIVNYRSGEAKDHLQHWGWHALPLLRMSKVVVCSGYLENVFGQFGLPTSTIPNFLNFEEMPYRCRTTLRPHFLSNRNFELHYNVASILRAFAIIQEKLPDAKLTVVGDGPERDNLRALAVELKLRKVEFTGSVPPSSMSAYYDSCDIYLNAPLIDNMPGSVLEAFACGVPVVTSSAGGIPFIVRNEVNGLMTPMNDHRAMADAALRLLNDPEFAVKLADRARADALTEYRWEVVRDGWHKEYVSRAE